MGGMASIPAHTRHWAGMPNIPAHARRMALCPRKETIFCIRALYKRMYSAKETHHFKEPTNRNHPIPHKPTASCSAYKHNYMSLLQKSPIKETIFCKRVLGIRAQCHWHAVGSSPQRWYRRLHVDESCHTHTHTHTTAQRWYQRLDEDETCHKHACEWHCIYS